MSRSRKQRRLIAVTTGDQDGIGPEVSLKALRSHGRHPDVVFCVFRAPTEDLADLQKLHTVFKRSLTIHWPNPSSRSLQKILAKIDRDQYDLLEILSDCSPAVWVKHVGRLCADGLFASMVTAPLSKTEILASGLNSVGHTQILESVTGQKPAFMGFIGERFCVVLGSGHVPLARAGSEYLKNFPAAVAASDQLRSMLSPRKSRLPIAVLAVNPHAGEKGIIGKEDESLSKKVASLREKFNLDGPLVPDVAFMKTNWDKYSVFLCAYHDQGLIPFKTIHGFEKGIHITLGLPICRSSVDHGTAKDLFGKNKADYRSMLKALEWSVNVSKAKGRKA